MISLIQGLIRTSDLTLHCLDVVDSTNTYLMNQSPVHPRHVCIAREQTQGRGRSGKAWHSAQDESLTLSFTLALSSDPTRWAGLSCAVGVILAEVLESHGIPAQLKWPNDLLLNGLKCAGVLIEIKQSVAVIGIGVNLALSTFPASLDYPITSLIQTRPDMFDELSREVLAAHIIDAMYEQLADFQKDGFACFRSRWLARHYHAGQCVQVITPGETVVGHAVGVDEQGALLVAVHTGEPPRAFLSGSVRAATE